MDEQNPPNPPNILLTKLAQLPVWLIVLIPSLVVRLPLLLLISPGRDEAAYAYWSQHPEPSYALLIQVCIRAASLLPLPDNLALRLPSLIAGSAAIYLLDRIFAARGYSRNLRLLSLSVFALCPWQVYVGAIVHPDIFLLVTILLFILAVRKHRLKLSALFAGLAVLAKPTGLIVLVVAVIFFLSRKIERPANRLLLTGVVCAVAAPAFIFVKWPMLQALAAFGRLNQNMLLSQLLLFGVAPALLLGGPLFPAFAWQGIRERLQKFRTASQSDEAFVVLLLSLGFLIMFGGAALLTGQIKGNWLLPALVIAWPANPVKMNRIIVGAFAGLTILAGIVTMWVFVHPESMTKAEEQSNWLRQSYVLQAGARESMFPWIASWSARLHEYQPVDDFAEDVLVSWRRHSVSATPPRWIVCDDYGLAAQLAFIWQENDTRIIIPNDGIFWRTLPSGQTEELPGGVLLLGLNTPPTRLWQRVQPATSLESVAHPVTGHPVQLAVSDGQLFE